MNSLLKMLITGKADEHVFLSLETHTQNNYGYLHLCLQIQIGLIMIYIKNGINQPSSSSNY